MTAVPGLVPATDNSKTTAMKFLLAVLLLPCFCSGQAFRKMSFTEDKIEFKSVKMSFTDSKAKVFDGYKNASIKINSSFGDITSAIVDIDLGGYYRLSDGMTDRVDYSDDNSGTTIKLHLKDLNADRQLNVIISLKYDSLFDDKPSLITVLITDVTSKKEGKFFRLEGFD